MIPHIVFIFCVENSRNAPAPMPMLPTENRLTVDWPWPWKNWQIKFWNNEMEEDLCERGYEPLSKEEKASCWMSFPGCTKFLPFLPTKNQTRRVQQPRHERNLGNSGAGDESFSSSRSLVPSCLVQNRPTVMPRWIHTSHNRVVHASSSFWMICSGPISHPWISLVLW